MGMAFRVGSVTWVWHFGRVWQDKGQQLGIFLENIEKGMAFLEKGLAFRVMGSEGSTFSAIPADPEGRQGAAKVGI